MFRGLIRAAARPTVGRRIIGERLSRVPVSTSAVTSVTSWAGLALVRTRHSWYLVLYPEAPAQEAAHGG